MATGVPFSNTPLFSKAPPFLRSAPFGEARLSRLHALLDSLGGILWLPNQHNYTLTTDTAVAPVGDPVGYMGSHRQSLPENYIANSTFVGGTESTAATGWTLSSASGVTVSVVGMGVDADGYPYQDVRFVGTGTGTSGCVYYPAAIAYNLGTVIAASCKVSLIAGSFANLSSANVIVSGRTAANAYVGDIASVVNLITQATATHTYFSIAGSTTSATVANARFQLACIFINGAVIDFTIRISQPQLERGKPTAFTPTYGEAITRGTNFEPAWQDTTANKPILGVDADGKSILTFDGTDDFFRTGIQTPEAGYIAGVWACSGLNSLRAVFGSSNGSTVPGARITRTAANAALTQRSDGSIASQVTHTRVIGTEKVVMDGHYALSSSSIRVDGADEVSNAVSKTATSSNYFRIGATGSGADTQTSYWSGNMLAQIWIPGARPGETAEAEIRRLLAEITAVSGVV